MKENKFHWLSFHLHLPHVHKPSCRSLEQIKWKINCILCHWVIFAETSNKNYKLRARNVILD